MALRFDFVRQIQPLAQDGNQLPLATERALLVGVTNLRSQEREHVERVRSREARELSCAQGEPRLRRLGIDFLRGGLAIL